MKKSSAFDNFMWFLTAIACLCFFAVIVVTIGAVLITLCVASLQLCYEATATLVGG